MGLLFSQSLFAQTAPPLSGRILESQNPVAPPQAPAPQAPVLQLPEITTADVPAGGMTFLLQGVTFEGNQALDAMSLQMLLQPMIGREVTLADLHAMASAIASYYNARQFLLVQAIVPPQKVVDGIVRFQIIEGFIDRISVTESSPLLSDAAALAYLNGVEGARPLTRDMLERPLLLIDRLPALSVQAVLEPGVAPGSSSLGLALASEPAWSGNFYVDNFGSDATGETRTGIDVEYSGLAGIGDQLGVSLLTSEGSGVESGGLIYRVPVGSDGWLLEANVEHMNYTLGGQFSALGGHGEANNASIKMAFPLQLTATGNTEVWGMYRYRELRDVLDAVGDTNRRHVGHAELGVSSSGFDAFGGWNYAMLSYAAGELNLQNQAAKAADVYGQDGFFSKANMLLTRQQRLGARFGLTLLLQGQYAWQNLDSGEKFALGGPYSVRAYPVSELTGDDGWLAQCALQWYANEQVTLSVFADRGWVRFNADELRGNPWTDQYLSSAGVGFDWQGPYGFEVHASVAWAGDYESVADRGNTEGRFYGVLRKRF